MRANIPFNSVLLLHNSFLHFFSVLSVLAVFGLNATVHNSRLIIIIIIIIIIIMTCRLM